MFKHILRVHSLRLSRRLRLTRSAVATATSSSATAPAAAFSSLAESDSIDARSLQSRYSSGDLTVTACMTGMLARLDAVDNADNVWITRAFSDHVLSRAAELDAHPDPGALPLFGLPFAVKDNIDVAGFPTTNGMPAAHAYTPSPASSATAVTLLEEAGAICLGKTNMDQTATGLVGVRSPYGAARNSFDPELVSGGSSSGSAVAVATGQATFSLGTDTAGSGRVPAALNNLVGIKPTRGLISLRGVIPACETLDTISIFALSVADARRALGVCAAHDPEDPWSARAGSGPRLLYDGSEENKFKFTFGVLRPEQLEFFGNDAFAAAYARAIAELEAVGGAPVEVDYAPFLETAKLLYEGPWVAERYAANATQLQKCPDAMDPTVRGILSSAEPRTAVEAFEATYRLAELRRQAEAELAAAQVDCLVTPTIGTAYTVADLAAEPVKCNSDFGQYCNYMNLLGMCAVAVPAGFTEDRDTRDQAGARATPMPFGLTIAAAGSRDNLCADVATLLEAKLGLPAGATGHVVGASAAKAEPGWSPTCPALPEEDMVKVVAVGAHMSGLPLCWQLTQRGGRLLERTRTAPRYRMFAFDQLTPPRPGITEVEEGGAAGAGTGAGGESVDVEVWQVPASEFGSFVAGIPPPLGIGTIKLESGDTAHGFICPEYEVRAHGAKDITHLGGWRAFLEEKT